MKPKQILQTIKRDRALYLKELKAHIKKEEWSRALICIVDIQACDDAKFYLTQVSEEGRNEA